MKLLDHEKRRALERLHWLKDNLRFAVHVATHAEKSREPEPPMDEHYEEVETLLEDETEEAIGVAVDILEGRLTL